MDDGGTGAGAATRGDSDGGGERHRRRLRQRAREQGLRSSAHVAFGKSRGAGRGARRLRADRLRNGGAGPGIPRRRDAASRYGRIDGVVNSTGHPPSGEILELTDEEWHGALDLVLLNVVRMARLVTPAMLRHGGGAIVNVSTFSAFEPSPAFPLSSALRAALAGFTKLYADRYAAEGVRMNNLLPGFWRASR